MEHLKENAGAVNVDFSKEDDARIRKALEVIGGPKGTRYPEAFADMCFADSPELGKK